MLEDWGFYGCHSKTIWKAKKNTFGQIIVLVFPAYYSTILVNPHTFF